MNLTIEIVRGLSPQQPFRKRFTLVLSKWEHEHLHLIKMLNLRRIVIAYDDNPEEWRIGSLKAVVKFPLRIITIKLRYNIHEGQILRAYLWTDISKDLPSEIR